MKKIELENMEMLEGGNICNGFASGFLSGVGFGLAFTGAGIGLGLAFAGAAVALDLYCES